MYRTVHEPSRQAKKPASPISMAKTLPFVSYKRVLVIPRVNIIFAGSEAGVRGAIEVAGLGEHFVTVRGDRTRGTVVRVLHIDEDPAGVKIDLEGTARADVIRVNGDGTAEVEELAEQPADAALLAQARAALDELAQMNAELKKRGRASPLFVRGLDTLNAMSYAYP
jgi:hypothetical protein